MATARKFLWNVELINSTDRRDNAVERVRAGTDEEAGQMALRQYNGTGWGWSLGRVWRVQKPRTKSLESRVNKKLKATASALKKMQVQPSLNFGRVLPPPQRIPEPFDVLLERARKNLGWETMKDRGVDRLDFHEVSVHRMRDLLRMAFVAGQNAPPEGKF